MLGIVQRTFSSLLSLAILPCLALDHAFYNVPSLKYGKPSYAPPFGNMGADQAYDAPQLKDFGFTQTPGNHCHHRSASYWNFFSLVTYLENDKKTLPLLKISKHMMMEYQLTQEISCQHFGGTQQMVRWAQAFATIGWKHYNGVEISWKHCNDVIVSWKHYSDVGR